MTEEHKRDQEPELGQLPGPPPVPTPTPEQFIRAAMGAAGAAPAPAVKRRRLPKRRPAEFSAFVTSATALAAYFGIHHAAGILYAGLGVAATLPFAVSAIVDLWRLAFAGRLGR